MAIDCVAATCLICKTTSEEPERDGAHPLGYLCAPCFRKRLAELGG